MLKIALLVCTLAGAVIGALVADDRWIGAQIGGFAGALIPATLWAAWVGICRLFGVSAQ